YWTRSFEEFAVKNARARSLKLGLNAYQRPFVWFFWWNGRDCVEDGYFTEAVLLERMKIKMSELASLQGVGPLAREIDQNFPRYLEHHYPNGLLRHLYESACKKATGPKPA